MKIRIAVIMLLLCLLLSACSGPNETYTGDNNTSGNGQNNYIAQACVKLLTCYKLNEYGEFIESIKDKLPPGFVSWEGLSHLGAFYGVGFDGYFDRYWYAVGERGNLFQIHIDHSPELSTTKVKTISASRDMQTMKEISDKDSDVIIKRGDYEYLYHYGQLFWIIWYDSGVQYKLTGFDSSHKLVQSLLSTNVTTANAAFAEMTKNLATE